MELTEAIVRRVMTRHFQEQPLEQLRLEAVLATVLRAPSAGFSQGVDLLVLTEQSTRERFWQLVSEPDWRSSDAARGLLAAPVIVLPVADRAAYRSRYREGDKSTTMLGEKDLSDWPVPYWLIDAAFASMLLLLAATDAGLGALFFQLHRKHDQILKGLAIPEDRELIGAIALGYRAPLDPRTSPSRRPRRPLDEVVHRERW